MEVPLSQQIEIKETPNNEELRIPPTETEQSIPEPRFSSFLRETQDFESVRISLASEKDLDDVFALKRMGYFIRSRNSTSERSDSTANLPSSFYTSQRPTRPESYAIGTSENNSMLHMRTQTTFSPEQLKLITNKTAKFSSEDLSLAKKADPTAMILSQLILKKERQDSLKNYCESVKSQIQENLRINIADLQSKRNSLVAKLDLYLEEAINVAKQAEAKKQAELNKKQSELEIYDEEIDSLITRLKNWNESDERGTSQAIKDAKKYLKENIDEKFIHRNWIWDNPVEFDYEVVKKESNNLILFTEKKNYRHRSTNLTASRHEESKLFGSSENFSKEECSGSKCKHCTRKHSKFDVGKNEYPKKMLPTKFLDFDNEATRDSMMSIGHLNTSSVFDIRL